MPEFEPIFTSTTGELECGCAFDQPGVVERGDWRECPDHGPLMRVVHAQICAPDVIGDEPSPPVVRVRILLNPDPLAKHLGYTPGTPMYPVFEYLTVGSDHTWLCEQAWQVGNLDDIDPEDLPGRFSAGEHADRAVDGDVRELAARYRHRPARSLSAGDVVAIGEDFYACAGLGWEPIDEPFIVSGPIPTLAPADPPDEARARRLPNLLDGPE